MKLQELQDKGLRLCYRKKRHYANTDALHRRARLQPLARRRAEHLAFLFYKLHRADDDPLRLVLPGGPVTRSANKIRLQAEFPEKSKFQHGPEYRGVDIWNRVPAAVQKSTTIARFKTGLKRVVNLTDPNAIEHGR